MIIPIFDKRFLLPAHQRRIKCKQVLQYSTHTYIAWNIFPAKAFSIMSHK